MSAALRRAQGVGPALSEGDGVSATMRGPGESVSIVLSGCDYCSKRGV